MNCPPDSRSLDTLGRGAGRQAVHLTSTSVGYYHTLSSTGTVTQVLPPSLTEATILNFIKYGSGVPGGVNLAKAPTEGGGLDASLPLFHKLLTDRCLEPDKVGWST